MFSNGHAGSVCAGTHLIAGNISEQMDEGVGDSEQSCSGTCASARLPGTSEADMIKRILLAVVVVFVVWSVIDFVIHGVLLAQAYRDTAQLWRPMEQMKVGLMRVVVLISATVFVCLYAFFVGKKSVATALKFGLLFGLGAGISMGYGTYAVQPIPYKIAITWFLGTVVQATVAGLLTGLIVKE
jgi:hypothetical protein